MASHWGQQEALTIPRSKGQKEKVPEPKERTHVGEGAAQASQRLQVGTVGPTQPRGPPVRRKLSSHSAPGGSSRQVSREGARVLPVRA